MNARLLTLSLVPALLAAGCITDGALDTTGTGLEDDDRASTGDAYAPVLDLRAAIHESVATGEPVTLKAQPVINRLGWSTGLGQAMEFEVTLRESEVVTDAVWAEVDGERVDLPPVETYEGDVVGRPGWIVRVTLTDEWVRGIILGTEFNAVGEAPLGPVQYLIRVGLDGNLPHGTRLAEEDDEDEEGRGAMFTYAEDGTVRFDKPDWPERDCLELVPPFLSPVLERPAEVEEIRADIVLDADAQFHEALGDETFPIMIAMLQEAEPIFEQEIGLRLNLVGVHVNTDPEYYPSPGNKSPLTRLADYWNAREDVERDMVHLFTGQTSSYAMANCIGGAGVPELAYTFTPLNWDMHTPAFHTMAFAHELGHILSAHHHYGNHVETDGQLATIMIQGYTPGHRPVFSSLSQSAMRGWAEEYLQS